MAVTNEHNALLATLEEARLAAEETERRVTARLRRGTDPFFPALTDRLPLPPAVPVECDADRILRGEVPTKRMRINAKTEPPRAPEPPSETRYSIINGRTRRP